MSSRVPPTLPITGRLGEAVTAARTALGVLQLCHASRVYRTVLHVTSPIMAPCTAPVVPQQACSCATCACHALVANKPSHQDVSRAKIQASIAAGLVLVNGRPAAKASAQLRAGDVVSARILPPPPMQVRGTRGT